MKRAIREHLREFIAVGALFVVGLFVTGYILAQQQYPYPEWLPFLGDERFELTAELSSAQAVTPGQGQTVNIAGVKAGDISEVELVDGKAVVTMLVEQQYEPILRSDATVLLRPRTGLQDMTLEVDPGRDGEQLEEGATIPLAQTKPNVQPDQILASLDGDTRRYLQLLIAGGAEGLGGRGEQLSATLRRFEPLGLYLARIGNALSERRRNIASVITSFRELGEELGRADTRLSEWVSSQNAALGAFANQEASIRETLRELPSALAATRKGLDSGATLANQLGPASEALIPAARAFRPAQESVQALFKDTYEPIRDQIRPFTREVQTPVRHLKQASRPLVTTTKGLAGSFSDLNRLFNALAYNPPGPQEGYLFWLAWLNHNTNGAFQLADAHGPLARGIVLQSCNTAYLADQLTASRPYLRTVQQLTNVPSSSVVCALDPTAPPLPPIPPTRPEVP